MRPGGRVTAWPPYRGSARLPHTGVAGACAPPNPLLAPGQPHSAAPALATSQEPLCRRDRGPALARRRGAERAGGRLEDRLDDVVQVAAVADVHVQADARVVHERLQEVLREVDVVGADELLPGRELRVEGEVRAPGEIDDRLDE